MENFKDQPLIVGLKTIAKMLDVSTKTIVRMHHDGQIRLYRVRGKLFAKFEELKADIEKLAEPLV